MSAKVHLGSEEGGESGSNGPPEVLVPGLDAGLPTRKPLQLDPIPGTAVAASEKYAPAVKEERENAEQEDGDENGEEAGEDAFPVEALPQRTGKQMLLDAEERIRLKKDTSAKMETVEETLAYFQQRLEEPRFLIMPETKWMQKWDMCTFFALIFTALVTPYEVACLTVAINGLFFVNRVIDFIFVIDMCFAFFTAYKTDKKHGNQWVKDLSKIRMHYLKSWFAIDLISIIPFDMLDMYADLGAASYLKILRIIRVLRLLKLLRVIKASRLYQRYEASMSLPYAYVGLAKFSVLLIVVGHWMACAWVMSGTLQAESRHTWLDQLAEDYYCFGDSCPDPPRNMLKSYEVYAAAIYWSIVTITSVGYGDITAQNNDEMIVCTLYLLMGSCLWAYIIGNATAIVSTGDPASIEHHQTMDALNAFMADKAFPDELRRRLRTFFHNSKELAKNEGYQALVERMSPKLKAEVSERNAAWLKQLEYFKDRGQPREVNREFLVAVSHNLNGTVYEPREPIKWQNRLYCVGKGVASRAGHIRTAGCFWGEDFILESFELKDKQPAHALTFVEVLVLTREDFFRVLDHYPGEKRLVRKATVRMAIRRGIMHTAQKIVESRSRKRSISWFGLVDQQLSADVELKDEKPVGEVISEQSIELKQKIDALEIKLQTELTSIARTLHHLTALLGGAGTAAASGQGFLVPEPSAT